MIRVALLIFALIGFVGWLNGRDIQACMDRGYSADHCYTILNP